MNVLITGAGGFIGSHLVAALCSDNIHIIAQVRRLENHSDLPENSTVTWVEGDLQDSHFVSTLFNKVDVLIHLAGLAHVNSTLEEHLAGTFNVAQVVMENARRAGVQRLIYISSCKANYPEHSVYGKVRLQTEELALALHKPPEFSVCCLRPALVYGKNMQGNLVRLISYCKLRFLPVFVGSATAMGMVSVADLCSAIKVALHQPELDGVVWEINDGESYSLNRLVQFMRNKFGYAQPMFKIGSGVMGALCTMAGLILSALSNKKAGGKYSRLYQALYKEPYTPDNNFAVKTGWRPIDTFYSSFETLAGK